MIQIVSPTRAWDVAQKVKGKRFALDTETTGLIWCQDVMIGLGVYCEDEDVQVYIPTRSAMEIKMVQKAFDGVADDADSVAVFQNVKFDCHFLNINPWNRKWLLIDVAVVAHLINNRTPKTLEYLEGHYLGKSSKRDILMDAGTLITKGKNKGKKKKVAGKNIQFLPTDVQAFYCVNDCKVTYQLAEKLVPYLQPMKLWDLLMKDMRYIGSLWQVERRGMMLDEQFLREKQQLLSLHRDELEKELYHQIGYEFNWRSSKQLSKAIYDDMGIEKPRNPFLDENGEEHGFHAMSKLYKSTCTSSKLLLIHDHPLASLLQHLKESAKMVATIENWLVRRDQAGAVHTTFRPAGTVTGRLSSREPNTQNIPDVIGKKNMYARDKDLKLDINLRWGFVAHQGYCFLRIDYKQMEAVFFGLQSRDPGIMEIIRKGGDIHMTIALRVWGDCGEELNKQHRSWSKTIVFGLIYGMGVDAMSQTLQVSTLEAARIKTQFLAQFPRLAPWFNDVKNSCTRHGFIRYWSGRRWHEPDQNRTYRAPNAAVQGGCAEITSIAVVRCQEWLDEHPEYDCHMVNIVHDEIMFEVPIEHVLTVAPHLMRIMQVEDLFNHPFAVDATCGLTYGTAVSLPAGDTLPIDFFKYTPHYDDEIRTLSDFGDFILDNPDDTEMEKEVAYADTGKVQETASKESIEVV